MKNRIDRNEDGSIDEIVISNVDLHIEQMDDGFWWMGIYDGSSTRGHTNRMALSITSKKRICLVINENDLIDEVVITPAAITKT